MSSLFFVFVFLIFAERKKDHIKRILSIFTLSQKTHRIPWILVDGPKASGKSTFIRTALSLLYSQSSAKYSVSTKNLNLCSQSSAKYSVSTKNLNLCSQSSAKYSVSTKNLNQQAA